VELESVGEYSVNGARMYSTFKEFTQQREEWKWWSSNTIGDDADVYAVMHHIERGEGFAVSNGSYKAQHGTAATVIEGRDGLHRMQTLVITPGHPDDQCAYRSKVAGILATTQLVNAMAEYTGITNGRCIMGCDGKSALEQCFWRGSRAPTEIPHFDIVTAVRREIAKSPIIWTQLYIPGHQVEPMDRGAVLNTEMDLKCKEHWKETNPEQQIWFQSEWSVWIRGKKTVSYLMKAIRTHCSILRAEQYWHKKSPQELQTVDWEGVKAITKTIPRQRQQWMTKHVSGFCSVGRMAVRTGLRESDKCPRCDECETAEHVWRCKNTES
jgi:hypothetical protein